MIRRHHAFLAAAVVGLLAGCAGAVDKSGAPAITTFTVGYAGTSASANGGSAAGRVFISELKGKFGDRLDLVEKRSLGEQVIIRALRNGEIDAAWISTRSLSDAGVRGFDALAAPMVLTNYEAEAALIEPQVAQPFLDQLQGTGLTGLTLAAGGLRRPVSSTEPLLRPEDWAGRSVTVIADSQRAAFEDVGAIPVSIEGVGQVGFDGEATAAELDLGSYNEAALSLIAPYITANVVLWPKVWLLAVNSERFESLSDGDQQLLREAAAAARQASTEPRDESAVALDLCAAGSRFATAPSEQVNRLKAAFEPTRQRLASDPVDGPLLAVVEGVAAASPEVETVAAPDNCTGDAPPSAAVGDVPTTRSDIPPGTYRMTLSLQDLLDHGIPEDRARINDLVITMTLKPDGTYQVVGDDIDPEKDSYTNLLWEVGTVTGTGRTVYFTPDLDEFRRLKAAGVNAAIDEPGNNLQTTPSAMTWKLVDGTLIFSDVAGIDDPIGRLWITAHPYKRID
jgi:TRAP-type C4-dicarboxylate transport system substrate-binding protein